MRPSIPRALRRSTAGVAIGFAFVAVVGCGGAPGATAPSGSGGGLPATSPIAAAGRTVRIVMTDAGCPPEPTTITAGPVTFEIANRDSGRSSEVELVQGDRIVGEKEHLTPGLTGTLALDLVAGSYQVYCPDALTERSAFTVTAASAAPSGSTASPPAAVGGLGAALRTATVGYAAYVRQEVAALVEATALFAAAVEAGDIAGARALYPAARIHYERIEPVAESFGDLDPAIDIRIADVEDPATWTGFHRLEKALWVDGSTTGMGPIAKRLVADIDRLSGLVATAEYQPAQLANGASELLDEVARSKVTGEEEAYSRIDLVDFAANVDGAQAAFELLQPALEIADPALAATLATRFAEVRAELQRFRSGTSYVTFEKLGPDDIRDLSARVAALAEPLSQVAARIVGGS
jgi:iron uptake system component EfeO